VCGMSQCLGHTGDEQTQADSRSVTGKGKVGLGSLLIDYQPAERRRGAEQG